LENRDIWIPNEDCHRLTEYVFGAYQRLETDFINYFNYVPLRNNHLHVSSQRLADFIQTTSQLLSKLFRLITFGESMKNYLRRAVKFVFGDTTEYEELLSELYKRYDKKVKNKDYLNYYDNLHDLDKSFIKDFWNGKCLSMKEVRFQQRIGILEYNCVIKPFKWENWLSWKNCRNAIEHRDKTEASLKEVLIGIACCAIILENIASRNSIKKSFDSNVFILPKTVWG